jgi:hypothetical protein
MKMREITKMPPVYLFGLDLGQAQDYTALAVVEFRQPPVISGEPSGRAEHHCRHLERWELGTSYPSIAKDILAKTSRLYGCRLVVDSTGVGRPVVDMLHEMGLSPIGVTITSGLNSGSDGEGGYTVPKRDLVSNLQVLLQTGRLKISEALPDAAMLRDELLRFQVKITPAGNDTYAAWREGAHDDLVLALALACWYGERHSYRRPPHQARPAIVLCHI